jgi:CRP/FNR family transcriptional regulator
MATTPTAPPPTKAQEDPLAYLPCSLIVRYRRGQAIYTQDQPSTMALYLVLEGKVKVSRIVDGTQEVIFDIFRPDEFFGESAFLNLSHHGEQATALENTGLMAWTTTQILDIAAQRPQLAVALIQVMAQRVVDFSRRLESFSVDNVEQRLIRSLLRFSERMGHVEEDGSRWVPPMTHELLSQYVGTSREIITFYMNQFRRKGYLRYSRKGITLAPNAFENPLAAIAGR